jgi:WD40 repeat protein
MGLSPLPAPQRPVNSAGCIRKLSILVLACAICAAVTSCKNASVAAGAGYQPAGIPVRFSVSFTINPNGGISIGGSVGIVTEIGIFDVGASVETGQPAPDETLLIIRHKTTSGIVDTVYRIGTGRSVTAVINGRTVVQVTNHKVLIDASKGNIKRIVIRSAPGQHPVTPVPSRTRGGITLLRSIHSNRLAISAVAWSPNGQLIADVGSTGDSLSPTVAEVRRASDGKVITIHHGLTHSAYNISWAPNGRRIATADYGCQCVRIWNASNGHTTTTIDASADEGVSWSPNSSFVVTAGAGDQPAVWSSSSGSQIATYTGYNSFGQPAVWSPHDDLVVSGNAIWNARSGRRVQRFDQPSRYGEFSLSSWSPAGERIISVSFGNLVLWDARTGATIWAAQFNGNGNILLSWSPDGHYIAYADDGGLAGIVDAVSGRSVRNFQDNTGAGFDALAWSPSGQYLATADNGNIQVWTAP